MKSAVLLATTFTAVLAFAACGDDESSGTTSPTSSNSSSSSSSGSGGATTSAGGNGGSTSSAGGSGGMGGSSAFAITSSAFGEGAMIPTIHECNSGGAGCMGNQISPALSWTPGPAGTQSYAIVMRDLDYMNGFVHWVIWDIPANVTSLPEDVDGSPMPSNVSGASQSAQGYRGPCSCGPNAVNTYEFTVYALDVLNVPNIAAGAQRPAAEAAVTALTPLATAALSGES